MEHGYVRRCRGAVRNAPWGHSIPGEAQRESALHSRAGCSLHWDRRSVSSNGGRRHSCPCSCERNGACLRGRRGPCRHQCRGGQRAGCGCRSERGRANPAGPLWDGPMVRNSSGPDEQITCSRSRPVVRRAGGRSDPTRGRGGSIVRVTPSWAVYAPSERQIPPRNTCTTPGCAGTTTPMARSASPIARAVHSPRGRTFSPNTARVNRRPQASPIAPAATSTATSAQQQPTQYAACTGRGAASRRALHASSRSGTRTGYGRHASRCSSEASAGTRRPPPVRVRPRTAAPSRPTRLCWPARRRPRSRDRPLSSNGTELCGMERRETQKETTRTTL